MKIPYVQNISQLFKNKLILWLQIISFIVAIVVISTIIVDYGFVLRQNEMKVIYDIYIVAWYFYLITYTLQLISRWKCINKKNILMTAFLGVLLYMSVLPEIVTTTTHKWLNVILQILSNKYYVLLLLGIFAIMDISKGIVVFINKKTNPAFLMATVFAIIIFIGTILLLLPRSTHENIQLSIIDSLFISTSAVCVTGLSPVEIANTFSIEGQIIIALLVQVGGLGVMTITSFFTMFFMGNTGLYNQLALKDMVGGGTFNSLISTLIYILSFTFVIELFGALLIWMNIHSTMGMTIQEELFFAIFHAVSAFCNAGFSNLSGNLGNELLLNDHNSFYIVISCLIILGGIGYPILVNFKNLFYYYIKSAYLKLTRKSHKHVRYNHLLNLNTKIVLITTFALLILGMFFILILEWNNAFVGMSVWDKLTQSFFYSVTPRTAGFNSIDLNQFSMMTIFVVMLLMWIGGGAQSTAGGIKVNTFATSIANFISVVRGRNNVVLFNREIPSDSVRRAFAAMFGAIIVIIISFFALTFIEPQISPLNLFFETVSAFATVGLSLNVTPLLGGGGKLILIILMFIGRVGLATIIMSFIKQKKSDRLKYPQDNIIIN